MTRLVALATLLLAALLVAPAPAGAAAAPDPVAEAARQLAEDPVYVAPESALAVGIDQERIRSEVRTASTPVFVAVLPASVEEEVADRALLPRALYEQLGAAGTYLTFVGDDFVTAGSTDVDGTGALALRLAEAHPFDPTAAATGFVAAVDEAAAEASTARPGDGAAGDAVVGTGLRPDSSVEDLWVFLVLPLLLGGFVVVARLSGRNPTPEDADAYPEHPREGQEEGEPDRATAS